MDFVADRLGLLFCLIERIIQANLLGLQLEWCVAGLGEIKKVSLGENDGFEEVFYN